MPSKQGAVWRDRPLELILEGRRYVPVSRNGYFSSSFMYMLRKRGGLTVLDTHYPVAFRPMYIGKHRYTYVCLSDLKRLIDAINTTPTSLTQRLKAYIQEHAPYYQKHHVTSVQFARTVQRAGIRLSEALIREIVRECRKRDPDLLIGLSHKALICRLLERDPALRLSFPLYETIRMRAERQFGCTFTRFVAQEAVVAFDAHHGHFSNQLDQTVWASAQVAADYLGILPRSVAILRRKGKLDGVNLLRRYVYVTWESVHRYKEYQDAFKAAHPHHPAVRRVAD